MAAITVEQLGEALALVATNYGRSFDTPEAQQDILNVWRQQLGGCALEDVQAAVRDLLADPDVARFPPVAEIRKRTLNANRARRRATADADGEEVKCVTCNDSGFIDHGTTEDGDWYVAPCPQGCLPPATNRVRRAAPKKRKRTSKEQQLALNQPASLREAINTTARMVGDRPDVDPKVFDEPF